MWETVLTTLLVGVVTTVLGIIGKVISDWSKREKKKAEVIEGLEAKVGAYEAIEIGVKKAQVEFVDLIKEASKDGKLSEAEIGKAKALAIETATEVATGPAAEYLVKLSGDAVIGIIEWILGKKKAENGQE